MHKGHFKAGEQHQSDDWSPQVLQVILFSFLFLHSQCETSFVVHLKEYNVHAVPPGTISHPWFQFVKATFFANSLFSTYCLLTWSYLVNIWWGTFPYVGGHLQDNECFCLSWPIILSYYGGFKPCSSFFIWRDTWVAVLSVIYSGPTYLLAKTGVPHRICRVLPQLLHGSDSPNKPCKQRNGNDCIH